MEDINKKNIQSRVKEIISDYLMQLLNFLLLHEHFDFALIYGGKAYEHHNNLNLKKLYNFESFDVDVLLATNTNLFFNRFERERLKSLWRKLFHEFWSETASERKILKDTLNRHFKRKIIFRLPTESCVKEGIQSTVPGINSWSNHNSLDMMQSYFIQHILLQVGDVKLDLMQINLKPTAWLKSQDQQDLKKGIYYASKKFLDTLLLYSVKHNPKKFVKKQKVYKAIIDSESCCVEN